MNISSMKKNIAKEAHIMATLSVTIFLTLCLLVAEKYPGFSHINEMLWAAVGLFGASSLRFMDSLYDSNTPPTDGCLIKFLQWGENYLLAVDCRIFDFTFFTYFTGWLFFLIAYYHLGAIVFQIADMPFSFWAVISHNWYTACVSTLIAFATLLASTYQIFFVK